jgi:hypothetical protein
MVCFIRNAIEKILSDLRESEAAAVDDAADEEALLRECSRALYTFFSFGLEMLDVVSFREDVTLMF